MKIEKINETCTACGACASVCPKDCISFEFDEEGFYYPIIDKDKCIKCGLCEKNCHVLDLNVPEVEKTTYYGYTKDEKLRYQSSSGGAFSAIADIILKNNGNVYGAVFDCNECILKHASSDDVGIETLRKSKYIESYMGKTIKSIQKDIDNGRYVMFCGTPCQAAAVKKAIKDENDLLLVVDFICHGVPSAMLFKEHCKKIHKHEKLLSVDFRPKDKGWSSKNIRLRTRTRTRTRSYNCDTFYYGFIKKNAFLRKSCYDCNYREVHCSDITIADFWGYRKVQEDINDEKGLSLIVTNNNKGKVIVENLENFSIVSIDNKFSEYAYLPKSWSDEKKLRKRFYEEYRKYGFEKAAKKTYMQDYNLRNIKYAVKCLIGRE